MITFSVLQATCFVSIKCEAWKTISQRLVMFSECLARKIKINTSQPLFVCLTSDAHKTFNKTVLKLQDLSMQQLIC